MIDYKNVVKFISLRVLYLGCALSVTNSHALGVGKLSVLSRLGEPLDVTVDLTAASGGELSTLNVGLAPRSEFERLGISFPSNAASLVFEIQESSGGSTPQIRIRSNNAVDSSFLHLLIQLEWAGGSILREYTALIDPLDIQPDTTTSSQRPRQLLSSANSGNQSGVVIENQSVSGTYGPVGAGESLSLVVNQILPKGATRYQGWLAVYNANPGAFYQGNINELIRGSRLLIPSKDEMLSVSPSNARVQTDRLSTSGRNNNQTSSGTTNGTISISPVEKVKTASVPSASKPIKKTPIVEKKEKRKPTVAKTSNNKPKPNTAINVPEYAVIRKELDQFKQSVHSSRSERNKLNQRVSNVEGQLSRIATMLQTQSQALEDIKKQGAAVLSSQRRNTDVADQKLSGSATSVPSLPSIGIDQRGEGIQGSNSTQANEVRKKARLENSLPKTLPNTLPEGQVNIETGAISKNEQRNPVPKTSQNVNGANEQSSQKANEDAARKRRLAEVDAAIKNKVAEMRAKAKKALPRTSQTANNNPPESSIVSRNSINQPGLDAPRFVKESGIMSTITQLIGDWWPMLSKLLGALSLLIVGLFGWKKLKGSNITLPKRKRSGRKTESELSEEVEREFASLNSDDKKSNRLSMFEQETIGLGSSMLDLGEDDSQLASTMLESMNLNSGMDDSGFSSMMDSDHDSGLFLNTTEDKSNALKMTGKSDVIPLSSKNEVRPVQAIDQTAEYKLGTKNDGSVLVDNGHESFLSELDTAGNLSQQTAYSQGVEVDPIAEAEVYLAYERKNQAIQVLQEAYIKDPNRHALGLKLLSIYQDAGDTKFFESLAQKISKQAEEGEDPSLLDKVAKMGKAFLPASSVFAGGLGGATLGAVTASTNRGESGIDERPKNEIPVGESLDLKQITTSEVNEEALHVVDQISIDDASNFDVLSSSLGISTLQEPNKENVELPVSSLFENEKLDINLADPVLKLEDDIQTEDVSNLKISTVRSSEITSDIEATSVDDSDIDSLNMDSITVSLNEERLLESDIDLSMLQLEDEVSLTSLSESIDIETPKSIVSHSVEDALQDSLFETQLEPLTDSIFDLDESALLDRKKALEKELDDIDSIMEAASSIDETSMDSHALDDDSTFEDSMLDSLIVPPGIVSDTSLLHAGADTAMTELEVDSRLLDTTHATNSGLGMGGLESLSDSHVQESSYDSSQLEINQHDPDTALALAKAYIELGEMEIAKDFLGDVLREGNAEQKAEAKAMVSGI